MVEEATAGMDNVEGDDVEGDDVEGDDVEGVHVIAQGSCVHKKLRAKRSMAGYFSAAVAGPLKITG